MTPTMQALVKTQKGKGFLELRDVPVPTIGRDEVLIEVRAAGVCGTDLHILLDEFPYYPPVTLGHEFAGVICQVGEEVSGWSVGARVVAEPHTQACRACRYCREGQLCLCPTRRPIGFGQNGAFAKYVRMPAHLLHPIADGLSDDFAALAEPLSSVVNALLLRGHISPGDTVVIEGCGPIGLLAAQVARVAGAARVIITGVASDALQRLPVALELGADAALDASESVNLVDAILQLTGGQGPDVVVEASGAPLAISMGIQMLRRRGLFILLGLSGKKEVAVPWDLGIVKALDFVFSFATTFESWEIALSLLAQGKIDAERLITHRAPLSEWQGVFDALLAQKGIKAILAP